MSNRISIFNASVEDFALEVFTSAPEAGSVGDHENGRVVKYGKHLYIWCDHNGEWKKFANVSDASTLQSAIVAHSTLASTEMAALSTEEILLDAAMDAEELAMPSAITSLEEKASQQIAARQTQLDAEEAAKNSDVQSLQARSEGVISQLTSTQAVEQAVELSALSSLEARASVEESGLTAALAAQVSKQADEDASLDSALSVELSNEVAQQALKTSALASAVASRQTQDASVNVRLTAVETDVSAILVADNLGIDTFVEAVSRIESVNVAADQEFADEWSAVTLSRDNAIASRIDDFSGAGGLDEQLASEISSEVSDDSDLQDAVASLTSAREASVQAHQDTLDSLELLQSQQMAAISSGIQSTILLAEASHASHLTAIADLTSDRLAEHAILEAALSTAIVDHASDFSAVQDALDDEEASMLSAIASLSVAEAAGDTALSTSLSSEISTQVSDDSVLQAALDAEAAQFVSDSTTLADELTVVQSAELSMRLSLVSELSVAEDSMTVAQSTQTSAIQSVEARTSLMLKDALQDAEGSVVDTFTEVLSFINAVDDASDAAVLSYVTAFGADGSVGDAEDDRIAGDAAVQTALTSAITERTSTMTVYEDAESVEISTQLSSIESLEVREESRHKRVSFGGTWASQSKVTSFTVPASEWSDADFRLNENGMVQIFQQVTETTFRNLVAPIVIDPSNGDITVQLGTVPKLGFALFYSFGKEDDNSSLSVSSGGGGGGGSVPEFTMTSGGEYDGDTEKYIPTSLSEAVGMALPSYLYLMDYSGATSTTSYGYTSWSGVLTIHGVGIDWGIPASPNAEGLPYPYFRWYSEQSTDGGVTWSAQAYYDVEITDEYSYGSIQPHPSYNPSNFPVQSPVEGALYRVYAEGYKADGTLVARSGSSSAPYYFSDRNSYRYQPGQYSEYAGGVSTDYFWTQDGSNYSIGISHGGSADVTIVNPSISGFAPGDDLTTIGSTTIWSVYSNFSADDAQLGYGWDPDSVDLTLSGTDASLFDIAYDSGQQLSVTDSSGISLQFDGNIVPAAGTYTVTLTAQGEDTNGVSLSAVTWNITVIIS